MLEQRGRLLLRLPGESAAAEDVYRCLPPHANAVSELLAGCQAVANRGTSHRGGQALLWGAARAGSCWR